MAPSQRSRQKRLERKKSKRKAVVAGKRSRGEIGGSSSVAGSARAASGRPIYETLVPKDIFEKGIGNVVVSREVSEGVIAATFFLVDVYCLGVKDAIFAVMSRDEYIARVQKLSEVERFENADPVCTRKLVEGSVSYAADLGFAPHRAYRKARDIFGDLDPNACARAYAYGKDGKPFYVSGPRERPRQAERIVEKLRRRCGSEGFHFLVAESDDFSN
ncbi:hypothetical protein ACFL0Q_05530 [Thermodesulfobacteriota bacterium]